MFARLAMLAIVAAVMTGICKGSNFDAGDPRFVETLTRYDPSWQKIRQEDGVEVYSRKTASGLLAFKALAVLQAAADRIITLMRDVEGSKRWMPKLILKEILYPVQDVDAITYTVTKLPWPASARDYVLRNVLSLDRHLKALVLRAWSIKDPRRPVASRYVRATIKSLTMVVRPRGNRTEIIFYSMVDPGGSLPTFIVNWVQKDWVYTFLKNVERSANKTVPRLLPGIKDLYQKLRVILVENPKIKPLFMPSLDKPIFKKRKPF